MSEFIKGVQFGGVYSFPMMSVNSPLLRINSLSPTLDFSKDGGNFAASVGSVSEIQSSGFYTLNVINSTEMNAETISVIASAEGAVSWQDVIYTSVSSLNAPADMTTTAMSSLTSLIFTDPLSRYEGSTDRNLARAVAFLVNFVDFSGDTMQVKKSDDSTNFWTAATSGDSAAKPIVAKDPS
jgi:hypothetical protein